jgi:hypothetical protein
MNASAFWILTVLAILTLVSSAITRPAYGGSMGLGNLPGPFVSSDGTMNCTAVVASSVGHGPCGGANTMDVMGAILVGGEFGLKTNNGNGTLEATMDDYVSTYNFTTAKVQLGDLSSNLIVIGGPGVNQITWYYNNLRNSSGDRVLPVYFDKFPNGTDYIYAVATSNSYTIERDGLGRVSADYGVILMFQDGPRFVLILAGLGGSGTAAACQIISSYGSWNLQGAAAIVKYSDTNGDGLLDTLSVVEEASGPISTFNVASFLSFGLFSAALLPKLKAQRRRFPSRRQLLRLSIVLLLLLAVSQIALIAFSDSPGPDLYTFKDFSHPFVSSGGLFNCTAVVASSVGHGPCGGANTMDVMGAIMVGARFGMDATGGSLCSTLDDYISSYDMNTGQMNLSSLTSNLVVVGGPGVNQITWYYNNLRNSSGDRVLPVYFDKFPNGTDYIYVPSSGHYYTVEHDSQGRVSADYGVVTLFQDTTHGWWVLIAAGLGGAGTLAALRLLTTYRSWSLFGQGVVVKDSDTNGDGYLDTISVPELVGVGNSMDVFCDVNCRNAIRSIDWGALTPGETKNVTVYVRNEGQGGIVLALNISDWTPPTASNYLSIGWNYSGGVVQSGQTVPIMLTLNVNSSVTGVTDFGVNITISSD